VIVVNVDIGFPFPTRFRRHFEKHARRIVKITRMKCEIKINGGYDNGKRSKYSRTNE
jgi:hypothetical protein